MKKHSFLIKLPRMAGFAAALFLTATTSLRGQDSWDVVLSGSQKGVAQITFNPDFTIDGVEVITTKPRPSINTDPNERPGIPGGQRVTGAVTNGSTTNIFFYGTSPLAGMWSLDNSGLIIGILLEGDESSTNGISFRGRIRGNRLNLVGHHEGRKIHYRGIPLVPLTDISGNFYSFGEKNGAPYMEFFNLAPDALQNQYIVTGTGPAYEFMGVALLSGQNNLAITSIQSIGTNGVLSAISGSYNISKGRGSLSGVDEINSRVTAKVRRQPDP
jgi:hypothetical protein